MLAKCFWPQLISWAWLLETCNEFHRSMFVRLEYRIKKSLSHDISLFGKLALFIRSCHLQCKIVFYFWAATFRANNRVLFPDHEEKLGFRCLYYCKMGIFLITDNTDKCTMKLLPCWTPSLQPICFFLSFPLYGPEFILFVCC